MIFKGDQPIAGNHIESMIVKGDQPVVSPIENKNIYVKKARELLIEFDFIITEDESKISCHRPVFGLAGAEDCIEFDKQYKEVKMYRMLKKKSFKTKLKMFLFGDSKYKPEYLPIKLDDFETVILKRLVEELDWEKELDIDD